MSGAPMIPAFRPSSTSPTSAPGTTPEAREAARLRFVAAADAVVGAFNDWLNAGAGLDAAASEIRAVGHRLAGVWGACFGGGAR